MKSRDHLLLLLLACPPMVRAQILDAGNTSPVAGDAFIEDYHVGYVDHGPAGAGQTWDFSALVPDGSSYTLTFQDAASTGHAADFPNANLAASAGPDLFQFYTTNSAGIVYHGNYLEATSEEMVYQDAEQIFTYPADWGAFWSDGFTSDYVQSGQARYRVGSLWCLADGYGTLVMPYGTVSNVLRVMTLEQYIDSLVGVSGFDYVLTSYAFYKPGTHLPLLAVHSDTITDPGGTTVVQHHSDWIEGGPQGIADGTEHAIGMDLFPNPASAQVSLVFGAPAGSLELELFDATGRRVRSERLHHATMGIQRYDLDISDLPPGPYELRLMAADGQQGTRCLMVQ